jgi:hypothetical protein
MRSRRPQIALGDLLRATRRLRAKGDDRERIARLLGFDWSTGADVVDDTPGPVMVSPLAADTGLDDVGDGPEYDDESKKPLDPQVDRVPETTRLVVPSRIRHERTEVVRDLGVTPLPSEGQAEGLAPSTIADPLLLPLWTRGILVAALSTTSEDGPIDVESVVEAMAKLQPLQTLPRLPWPTLRRGVQLLLDRGAGMVPFFQDQDWMVTVMSRIVGADRLDIRHFVGSPLHRAGRGPRLRWGAYQPPPPGTVVVLLTDLGLGRPPLSEDWASVDEWLEFSTKLRRAGCAVVAFVPYTPDRWPQELARTMTIVRWDRPTTASSVRARVGPAHHW